MGAVFTPITALIFPAWFIFAHQDSRALGIFLGASAVGGMIGGLTFAAIAKKLPQRTWLIGATACYALGLTGLYFLQPGSVLALGVSFLIGSVVSIMFAVPFTAFYSRTPHALMGRVGSLGAATGALFGALASLGFGWLVHTVSAPTALLACAAMMAGLALAFVTMPFTRLLDSPPQTTEADAKPNPAATQTPAS